MNVAVLKAGLTNQEYRKKQEMRSIFNYGTVCPSGLTQYLSFTWITRFLHTRAPARAITCNKRASMQSGAWADLTNFLTVFTLVHWRKQHGQNVPGALNCTNARKKPFLRSHLNMVTPIQILVIFYPKGFENQDLFDRSVVDDNTWFLRYVRYSLLEPNMRRNSVFSY